MTVRVAFLGDSHVACVALAARSMDLGRLRPTFFAHVLQRLDDLRVEGGLLRAGNDDLRRVLRGTSGGFDTIDPERFDLFVLMGLEFEFPFACLTQQFYSRGVTEQATRDQLAKSLAFTTLEKLRRVSERPVWLLHAPLVDPTRAKRRPEVLTYARFLALAGEVFRPLGASVLPQPEETRVEDHFSLPDFSRSPVRLRHSDGSPLLVKPDNHHKNETFGRAIVRDLVVRLETFKPDERPNRPDPNRPEPNSADPGPDAWRPRRLGTVQERDGKGLILRLDGCDGAQLSSSAALIWERCDGTRTEEEILAELCELVSAPEERPASRPARSARRTRRRRCSGARTRARAPSALGTKSDAAAAPGFGVRNLGGVSQPGEVVLVQLEKERRRFA